MTNDMYMELSHAPSVTMYHPSHLPGAVPRSIELCTFGVQDRSGGQDSNPFCFSDKQVVMDTRNFSHKKRSAE